VEKWQRISHINFPTGRLSLVEVQQIFHTIPFELDLIDRTDHFAWFSDKPNREHKRSVSQVGETVEQCHPARVLPRVMGIINAFKAGTKDVVKVPLMMNGHRCLIQYYALRDVDGSYLGTIEFTGSVEDILQLFEGGAWGGPSTSNSGNTEGAASGTVSDATPDATSGASHTQTQFEDSSTQATTAAEPSVPSAPVAPIIPTIPDATSSASTTLDEGPLPAFATQPEPVAALVEQSAPESGLNSNADSGDESEDSTPDATTGASAMGM
jgi:hypothetical protein